jgi:hypothetical protein
VTGAWRPGTRKTEPPNRSTGGYHRNSQKRWRPNDITDIDAASFAVAYCDEASIRR